jgi:hypothetical protein
VQFLFEIVGDGKRLVEFEGGFQVCKLFIRKIFIAPQKEVSSALDRLAPDHIGFSLEGAS